MTDTEIKRRKAICEAAHVDEIDDVSDGFHTFRQLYYQRMILFAAIVKQNKDKAWKSLRHEDGELCFGGGWFIVGVDTPEGSYTYHYEDNYYSLFDCKELERGKHWDGHTEKDVTRLLSLPSAKPEPCGDAVSRQYILDALDEYIEEYGEVDKEGNHDLKWCAMGEAKMVVNEAPSVQPEIIHCHDCIHAIEDALCGGYWCKGKAVTSDHYCGYAERRTDELGDS